MQMNKKGFVFIETILTIVVLTTTLVILYTNYSRAVISERRRLYYDDISYVYKTAVIRDILDKTINTARWDAKVKEVLDGKTEQDGQYIYVFNINSQIFNDNKLISEARTLLNYNQLVFIPLANIQTVKDCVNGKISDDNHKCTNTLKIIDGYSDATFKDYLKAIYVPIPEDNKIGDKEVKGILISLFYETKNGDEAISRGSYDLCLQTKIIKHEEERLARELSDQEKKDAIKNYGTDGSYSVDMQCENAYYNSWVYL